MGHGALSIGYCYFPMSLHYPLPSRDAINHVSSTSHLTSSLDDAQEKESGRARDANAKHQRASFQRSYANAKGVYSKYKKSSIGNGQPQRRSQLLGL